MEEPNRFIILLKKLWPTFYRWINTVFYFILSVIKGIVVYAIRQIRDL